MERGGPGRGKINVVFFISFICFWCFYTSAELLQHRHKTSRGGNILHLRIYILANLHYGIKQLSLSTHS